MSLRWPQFAKGLHVRTCQGCNHAQVMPDPATQKGDKWREARCRKCRSAGCLDYGSANIEDDKAGDDE